MDHERLDFIENDLNAPLPDEVPAPPPKSTHDSKSRTVQSLLSQNQDLMARLTVALKRNIELEQRLEKANQMLETTQAEYDVYKDHSRFYKEKISRLEYDLNDALMDKSEAEKEFAQIYTNMKEKEAHLLTVTKQLSRFKRYKKRLNKYVRPYLDTLKAEMFELNADLQAQDSKIVRQKETLDDLRLKMSEAVDHIQEQKKDHERDQTELVNKYEGQIQNLCEEMGKHKNKSEMFSKDNQELRLEKARLEERMIDLKDNCDTQIRNLKEDHEAKVQTISDETISLQNKSVMYERRYEEIKQDLDSRIKEHNSMRFNLTGQINTLDTKLKGANEALAELNSRHSGLETERDQTRDQLDSLQILFDEQVKKIEDLRTKYTATDKINKELSSSLSESRKQNESLKNRISTAEETFKKRLMALGQKINDERNTNQELQSKSKKVSGERTELMDRIQTLLSEIQSGYESDSQWYLKHLISVQLLNA